MDNTIQLYVDEEQEIKGYPITSPDRVIDENGTNIKDYVDEAINNAKLEGGNTQVDLSDYAKKSELHSHSNKSVLDGITSAKITEWNNKSTFDGNYNNLTNKPTIPTKTSQLTNDSGYLTSVPSEYVTETELNGKGFLTDKDISSIISNSKERITYYGYVGEPPNSWAYFPLIQFAPDDSGNYGNVVISGRIGGWLNDNSATYSITLLNRSNAKDGDTITATVQAMGEVAKALDIVDIEIYKQSDNSHIAYFKATFYPLWDITYATMQHSIIYDGSSSATVPSGTLVWSLSSCNKTILSTSGTLSQTGTPSKDSDLVNKAYTESYVNGKISELSKEIIDQQTDLNAHTSNTTIHVTSAEKQVWNNKANKTDIPTKTSQLTNDSGFITSIPSEYVTQTELTTEINNLKALLVDGNEVSY
jgi:hypothetical protein